MAKFTLKILRCSHCKIFKYVWSLFNTIHERIKPFVANPRKWSNTLKQFVGNGFGSLWVDEDDANTSILIF